MAELAKFANPTGRHGNCYTQVLHWAPPPGIRSTVSRRFWGPTYRSPRGRREWQLIQVDLCDLLPMRIGHGAVALDVPDDAAGRVPNLDAPPVARIVNIP